MKSNTSNQHNVGMQIQNFEHALSDSYLGYSRRHCIQLLSAMNIEPIAFAHWLAIPSQQLLLVFRHQHCMAVEHLVIDNQVAA